MRLPAQRDSSSAAAQQLDYRCIVASKNQGRSGIRFADNEESNGQKRGRRLLGGNAPRLGKHREARVHGRRSREGVHECSNVFRFDSVGKRHRMAREDQGHLVGLALHKALPRASEALAKGPGIGTSGQ